MQVEPDLRFMFSDVILGGEFKFVRIKSKESDKKYANPYRDSPVPIS